MNIKWILISESFYDKFINQRDFDMHFQDFNDLLSTIQNEDSIYYTLDLYDRLIYNGLSIVEWLYNDNKHMRDEKKLFLLKLRRMVELDSNVALQQIERLVNLDYSTPLATLIFYDWYQTRIDPRLIVQSQPQMLSARRFYLQFVDEAECFLDLSSWAFPLLFINKRVYQTIKKLKPFRDFRNEMILHLSALNDHGISLFEEHHHENETVVLQHLSIAGDIYCSAQGNPEYEKQNLTFEFPRDLGGTVYVTCAPHTKLFRKDSNVRIYFCWNHPDVQNGEKLLIGHIGEHL